MHDVSDAINILDPVLNKSGSSSDAKWNCTSDGSTATDFASSNAGKCQSHSSTASGKSLKDAFENVTSTDTGKVDGTTVWLVSWQK